MKKFLAIFLIGSFCLPLAGLAQMQPDEKKEEENLKMVFGYIQPEYEYKFLGDQGTGKKLDESTLYFNRLRLGVKGKVARDFSYVAVAELSPTLDGPYLLIASASYDRFAPYAKITVGQFMLPFGLELNTPCNKLHTIDRSLFVENLSGHFQDIGVMLSGGTGKRSFLGSKTENFFGYKLAITNGTGVNVLDDNRKKNLTARLTWHPWEFFTLGASYRTGKYPSLAAESEEDRRSGVAFDVELKYKNFLLQSQYIAASDKGSFTTGGGCCSGPVQVHQNSVDRDGFMVQVLYMTPWKIQPVFKFDYYDPNVEVDAGEDRKQYIQNTFTSGLNYFVNEQVRFQLNYVYRVEEKEAIHFKNDALLCQVQVDF